MQESNETNAAQMAPLGPNVSRLWGVLFEPSKTFGEINRRPNWLIPLIALIILMSAANTYVINAIGYENIVRQSMMQSPQVREMPTEQREELIRRQSESSFFRYFAYLGPVFGVVVLLIIAGLLFLALVLVGGESSFSRIFSVTCHSNFAYSVVAYFLTILVVLLTEDKASLNIQSVVQSNPGFLVSQRESPVLFAALASFDLTTMYQVFLLSLGLSKVGTKVSFGTSLGIVLCLWLIYIVIKVVGAFLFS